MVLRRWDPRLDPRLRPDQWERVARRRRRGLGVAAGLLLGTVLGLAAWWSTRDLTRQMAPEAVVGAAARALLAAPGYRFTADSLASPLLKGLQGAKVAGRERPLRH